jgi:ABC-type lipoprotein release transport system permease subunit
MAIALAASIIPAVRVSRAEPLSLLQAGRAAA